MKLFLKNRIVEYSKPLIMGILNVTPDSFSDGGKFVNPEDAVLQAEALIEDGADIIDVGGESTRPGAQKVGIEEEMDRVIPVIEKIKEEFPVLVSVDTYKDRVARAAVLEGGADIVNDISGMRFTDQMVSTIAELDVPVILMHIKGTPENMQKDPSYQDVIGEIKQYFRERINYVFAKGIKKEKIIIDPGIGFGKRLQDNIEIIRRLEEFRQFDCPILIGLSRKTFLGQITGEDTPIDREAETITANLISILNGASIIRVHNVENAVKSLKVLSHLTDLNNV
jgi:dihydropteroate synthase